MQISMVRLHTKSRCPTLRKGRTLLTVYIANKHGEIAGKKYLLRHLWEVGHFRIEARTGVY